ncbi:L-threonylcarbamoyladenylate synthase [Moraxella sp. Tifton1]|uniref:Threonylcarbamoyl-AMP synthase n=1 Tax=Moraxella oculi TaxID=2940516 RepID=A0ABW8U7L9_9GAMM|nr:L-threonylcarbamoyladenylate synthase [Moraxella sp. Tifton1]MCL1623990.1 L-threonylcarbamoyladenylate synthase [Moraxella sp. Tifton1]
MSDLEIFGRHETKNVADFLKSGGVLAYPSESVWGLGCDAFDDRAIERIFTLKARPVHKGLIVLTDEVDRLVPLLVDLPKFLQDELLQRMRALYNDHDIKTTVQAQTWLIPVAKSACPPKILMGGFDTLAVRVTHHKILKSICQALVCDKNPYGFLVSTSCNPSGEPSATNLGQAQAYFGDKIAYLDAQTLGFDKPSQIIDVMTGAAVR